MDKIHFQIIEKATHKRAKLWKTEVGAIIKLHSRGPEGILSHSEINSIEDIGRRLGMLPKTEVDLRIEAIARKKRTMGSGRNYRGRH